jgi:hypothetical protein
MKSFSARLVILASLLLLTSTFNSCSKNDIGCKGLNHNKDFEVSCKGLEQKTLCELQQAKDATERYQNISAAIADGYADISVVVPNMGFHYMKSTLVDAVFDITRPEILVYNKTHEGLTELVAVEYAVPIDMTPDQAPGGFTGTNDVWDRNTGFGLWLLHAWVWKSNASGVFNPTNPGVHLHI